MTRLLFVSFLVLSVMPTSIFAQSCDALNALDWILGDWAARDEKHVTHETWTRVSAKTYEGTGTVILKSTGENRSSESMRLVEMSGAVFYIPKAAHNAFPIAFRLASCTEGSAIFENKNHDFPKQLKYQRVGADSLHAYVSDGGSKGFVVRLGRENGN